MLAGFKDMSAKGKSAIQCTIEISIKLKAKNEAIYWEVVSELGVGLAGTIGLGIQDNFGVDNIGVYIQKDLIFEGIKIEGNAVARLVVKKKRYRRG